MLCFCNFSHDDMQQTTSTAMHNHNLWCNWRLSFFFGGTVSFDSVSCMSGTIFDSPAPLWQCSPSYCWHAPGRSTTPKVHARIFSESFRNKNTKTNDEEKYRSSKTSVGAHVMWLWYISYSSYSYNSTIPDRYAGTFTLHFATVGFVMVLLTSTNLELEKNMT